MQRGANIPASPEDDVTVIVETGSPLNDGLFCSLFFSGIFVSFFFWFCSSSVKFCTYIVPGVRRRSPKGVIRKVTFSEADIVQYNPNDDNSDSETPIEQRQARGIRNEDGSISDFSVKNLSFSPPPASPQTRSPTKKRSAKVQASPMSPPPPSPLGNNSSFSIAISPPPPVIISGPSPSPVHKRGSVQSTPTSVNYSVPKSHTHPPATSAASPFKPHAPGDWACPMCTASNSAKHEWCEICGTDKPKHH